MTRILLFGDLAATGFGTVTTNLGVQMIALGHDLRFVSQNDLGELQEPFASRTFSVNEQRLGWMNAQEVYERGICAGLIDGSLWEDRWTPECVILTGDFYAARGLVFRHEGDERAFRTLPVLHYAPIEGEQLPPSWRILWDIVKPVAMSEFGAREIAKVTGSKPPVVYHGVDTQVFYPASPVRPIRLGSAVIRSRDEAKAYFGIPSHARVLLRTDRNMPRKMYPALMRSLAPVLADRPDAMLLMHCRMMDEGGDLRDSHSKFRRDIAGRMKFTGYPDKGMGFPRDTLNALINAADLYVTNSSEGFGLTIAEALACGVPVVGLDYSSVPEVIGPAGLLAPMAGLIDNNYGHFWAVADERAYGKMVGQLLDDEALCANLGAKGPRHVREHFSWVTAAQQFGSLAEHLVASAVRSGSPWPNASGDSLIAATGAGSGQDRSNMATANSASVAVAP